MTVNRLRLSFNQTIFIFAVPLKPHPEPKNSYFLSFIILAPVHV